MKRSAAHFDIDDASESLSTEIFNNVLIVMEIFEHLDPTYCVLLSGMNTFLYDAHRSFCKRLSWKWSHLSGPYLYRISNTMQRLGSLSLELGYDTGNVSMDYIKDSVSTLTVDITSGTSAYFSLLDHNPQSELAEITIHVDLSSPDIKIDLHEVQRPLNVRITGSSKTNNAYLFYKHRHQTFNVRLPNDSVVLVKYDGNGRCIFPNIDGIDCLVIYDIGLNDCDYDHIILREDREIFMDVTGNQRPENVYFRIRHYSDNNTLYDTQVLGYTGTTNEYGQLQYKNTTDRSIFDKVVEYQ